MRQALRLGLVGVGASASGLRVASSSCRPTRSVGAWSEHPDLRRRSGDRRIKLPPDPQVRVDPTAGCRDRARRVGRLRTSYNVDYGVRAAGAENTQSSRSRWRYSPSTGVARWSRAGLPSSLLSSIGTGRTQARPLDPRPTSQSSRTLIYVAATWSSATTTWYQLTLSGSRTRLSSISGDIFLRPISPTHVLAVYGHVRTTTSSCPSEAIERRRALMRKIVAEVRVVPPFGPAHP